MTIELDVVAKRLWERRVLSNAGVLVDADILVDTGVPPTFVNPAQAGIQVFGNGASCRT